MKKLLIGFVAAALLPMSASVMAKDICLQSNVGLNFKLKGVKSLKAAKTIKTVPLVGFMVQGSYVAPASGSATVLPDGTVQYGVFAYSVIFPGGNSISVHVANADATMAGTGGYDNDGDMMQNSTLTMTAVDCKTFTPA